MPSEEERKVIVYIEDEHELVSLVKLILKYHGFDLIGASNGYEGLRTVRRVKPDLVLLDIMMPDMDGWEVFRRMKADDELDEIPVIVVTVKDEVTDKALGLDVLKVDDYLTKPFEIEELVKSIYAALGEEANIPRRARLSA